MAFAVGDSVHVAGFGKGTVVALRNAGRLVVEVRGRSMIVAESQVTAVEARKGRCRAGAAAVAAGSEVPSRGSAPASIDLHGMTVEQATSALDEFLAGAMLAGHATVQVIHGRSGGRLKDAVHRRLKQLSSVRSFRLDPQNLGATVVTL